MKLKYSILIGLTTLLSGFIPLNKKQDNLTYTIYANSLCEANNIKEELITFFKDCCYSSLFDEIDYKLTSNIEKFKYDSYYSKHNVVVDYGNKIKMTGYLYKTTPSFVKFKYYFSASTNSMPEATSISVATDSLSDQI